jgi:hypothetical protein
MMKRGVEISEVEKQELHYERFHHPHPRVQLKMEVVVSYLQLVRQSASYVIHWSYAISVLPCPSPYAALAHHQGPFETRVHALFQR